MGVAISYMGTKKDIAPAVAEVVNKAADGVFLDVFAGMCSVGETIGTSRPIWVNDVQKFASLVGEALFTSQEAPYDAIRTSDVHFANFSNNLDVLEESFKIAFKLEAEMLKTEEFDDFDSEQLKIANRVLVDSNLLSNHKYCLFTLLYSCSFLGLRQCAHLDSIISSIDACLTQGIISDQQRRWLLIALARTMLRVSTTTGHFAQYLKPNQKSYRVFIRQRRRNVWEEWLCSMEEINAVGCISWRSLNRSFNKDAVSLLSMLTRSREAPAVIYADPPYTSDQYSRYYHLFETLVEYDYPQVTGAGRYRPNRYHSDFSKKTKSPMAVNKLLSQVAALGSDLVFSYPTNGLLYDKGYNIEDMMRAKFRKVEKCFEIDHRHSTFGASKGAAKASVREQIFLGRA